MEARRRYGSRAIFQDVPVVHTGEQHGYNQCPVPESGGSGLVIGVGGRGRVTGRGAG